MRGADVVVDRVPLGLRGAHRVRRGPLLGEVHDRVRLLLQQDVRQPVVLGGDVEVHEPDLAAGDFLPGPQPLPDGLDRGQRLHLELDVDLPAAQVVEDRDIMTVVRQVQRRRPAAEPVSAKYQNAHVLGAPSSIRGDSTVPAANHLVNPAPTWSPAGRLPCAPARHRPNRQDTHIRPGERTFAEVGSAFVGRAAELARCLAGRRGEPGLTPSRGGLARGRRGRVPGRGGRRRLGRCYAPSVPGTLPLGRLGVSSGREPGPFGIMTGGTGAGGSPWMGRNISFPCIQA